jgi:hypothetical protein
LVEQLVGNQETNDKGTFFSYRHAQDIHALGVKYEFPPSSPWSQVCVSIVISAALTPKICVRILWSRPKLEYPKEDCLPLEFPLSEAGVRLLAEAWPPIQKQLRQAIARGRPPEAPNQLLKPTRAAQPND